MAKLLGVNIKNVKTVFEPSMGSGKVVDWGAKKNFFGGFNIELVFQGMNHQGKFFQEFVRCNEDGVLDGRAFPSIQIVSLRD